MGTHIHLSNLCSYAVKVLNVVFVLLLFNRKTQTHQLEISKLKIILKKLPIWLENNIKLLHVLTLYRRNWKVNSANKLLMFKRITNYFSLIFCISSQEKDLTSTFHDYYMEVVTSSFGDDLDHIRQVWQWSFT